MQKSGRGEPLDQEGNGGAPPEQRVVPAHSMQEKEGGGPPTKRGKGGHPLRRSTRPLCMT